MKIRTVSGDSEIEDQLTLIFNDLKDDDQMTVFAGACAKLIVKCMRIKEIAEAGFYIDDDFLGLVLSDKKSGEEKFGTVIH